MCGCEVIKNLSCGLPAKATDEQKECLKEAMSIWKDLYNTTGDIVYKKNYDFAKKALRR